MQIQFEIPETVLHQLLDPVPLPEVAQVQYDIPTPEAIEDIEAAVGEQLERSGVLGGIRRGGRIAVGVGSRGIGRLPEIVAALVPSCACWGPSRSSSLPWAATAARPPRASARCCAHLGVTPERVGAPIESQMETVEVGRAADGTPVRIDRWPWRADGIIFVARIKPHTAFRGTYESGLAKMIAIGLGKQAGAAACHAARLRRDGTDGPGAGRGRPGARADSASGSPCWRTLTTNPIKSVAVPAERILADEPALLDEAQSGDAAHPVRRDRRAGHRRDRQEHQRRRRRP